MTPGSAAPDREAALALLLDRINYERQPIDAYGARALSLDRMRDLLARLGQPQAGLPVVHVAGTKGKGSTASMIAASLTAAGLRTGLFTSPHLAAIEERFNIDGVDCPPERFAQLVDSMRGVIAELDALAAARPQDELRPTFFDLTTALAWLHFAQPRVDAVVLEVGLGGRLDSTNVCEPVVSVITSISFDHTRQLGNTLAAIAREKAGIIKPGVPVVSGVLLDEPRQVIERIAAERGSPLVVLGRDFECAYHPPAHLDECSRPGHIDFRRHGGTKLANLANVEVGLVGAHQANNAAVALATLGILAERGWRVDEPACRAGLAAARCPARIEVVHRRPTVIIDAAHNVASAKALIAALDASFDARRRTLLFAAAKDKDIRGIFRELLPKFDRIVFTQFANSPRCVTPVELRDLALEACGPEVAGRARCFDSSRAAWEAAAQEASADDLICVTGSFFIAAEARPWVDATFQGSSGAGSTRL